MMVAGIACYHHHSKKCTSLIREHNMDGPTQTTLLVGDVASYQTTIIHIHIVVAKSGFFLFFSREIALYDYEDTRLRAYDFMMFYRLVTCDYLQTAKKLLRNVDLVEGISLTNTIAIHFRYIISFSSFKKRKCCIDLKCTIATTALRYLVVSAFR